MTPEGKIKRLVTQELKSRQDIYYFMPVPGGYGDATLDYVGCYRGKYFAIETKKPGGKPTARQEHTIRRMRAAGAQVFVIDGDLTDLKHWLDTTT